MITPNYLKVDKAITFFKSNSKIAPNPDKNIVNKEIDVFPNRCIS